jgi:hypothetical protein
VKRGLLKLTPEFICQQLMLPRGTVIDGATWDIVDRTIVLSVQHDSLSDVPDRHHAPLVMARTTWEA